MSTISREKFIEEITKAINTRGTGVFKAGLVCAKGIAQSLPPAEDDWIPVSEGLPDTDVPVLVSDGVYVWEDELQKDYEDGKTVYWWDSQCSFDFNDTAWMPRPKPYRKDGEEE